MLSRTTRAGEPARSYDIPADPISAFSRPGLAVERVEDRAPGPWRTPTATGVDLDYRRFDRTLDLDWRRTSYSALTAAAHGLPIRRSTSAAKSRSAGRTTRRR